MDNDYLRAVVLIINVGMSNLIAVLCLYSFCPLYKSTLIEAKAVELE